MSNISRQLVGGSNHGKVVSVPESYRTYVALVNEHGKLRPVDYVLPREEYRLESVSFPDDKPPIYFFVLVGMEPREAFELLLRNSCRAST